MRIPSFETGLFVMRQEFEINTFLYTFYFPFACCATAAAAFCIALHYYLLFTRDAHTISISLAHPILFFVRL